MNKARFVIIAIVSILIGACSNSRIYDDVQAIPSDDWTSENELEFNIVVSDTVAAYDILVHVRNNSSYAYSNLWLFIETSSPNGAVMRDTVELYLADNSGEWLGKGLGAVNSMLIPYKMNVRFPYRGIYSVKIQQGMRTDVLSGIKNIGLQVKRRE